MKRRSLLGGLGGLLSLPVLQSSTNPGDAGVAPRDEPDRDTSEEDIQDPDINRVGSWDDLQNDNNDGIIILTDDIDGGGETTSDNIDQGIHSVYGQGHTIENVTVEAEELIYTEDTRGIVTDITFRNITIDPTDRLGEYDRGEGGVLGGYGDVLQNCIFEDITVVTGTKVGAAEGRLSREVRNCIFRDITDLDTIGETYGPDDDFAPEVGIVAGRGDYDGIRNCITTGEINHSSSTNDFCGGIVGTNTYGDVVENCISIVNVDAPGTYGGTPTEGGIAGLNCLVESGKSQKISNSGGIIRNCYHPTEVPPDSATKFNVKDSVDISYQVPTANLQGQSPESRLSLDFQEEWQTTISYPEPIQDQVDLTSQRIYADGVNNVIINEDGEQIVIHS